MQMNHIAAKTPLNHLERLHGSRTFDRADFFRMISCLTGNDRFIPRGALTRFVFVCYNEFDN